METNYSSTDGNATAMLLQAPNSNDIQTNTTTQQTMTATIPEIRSSTLETSTRLTTIISDFPDISQDSIAMANTTYFDIDLNKHNNFSRDSYLEQLNGEFANYISPAIVFLVILMVVGLIGNVYVLYVYSKKNCNRTIIRFIQVLAIFDLFSCAIAMPGEIMDMSQNYTFGDNLLCPAFRTVNMFCTLASGSTLVVVAVDRYRRICYPLQIQIKPRTASTILLVVCIICVALSLPSAVVFGSKTIPTKVAYINGSDCSISDSISHTGLPLAFNGFQLLLFLIGAIALIVIYSLIARTICMQARQRKLRGRNRRRSLKNGSHLSPAYNQSLISSPSSPRTVDNRTVFKFSDSVMDNVLDLSDVIQSGGKDSTSNEINARELSSETIEDSHRKRHLSADQALDPKTDYYKTNNNNNSNGKGYPFLRLISIASSTTTDAELSSSTTVSPPDTPLDGQRLECVSLIKSRGPANGLSNTHSNRLSMDRVFYRQTSIKEEFSDPIPSPDSNDSKTQTSDVTLDSKTQTSDVILDSNTQTSDVTLDSKTQTSDVTLDSKTQTSGVTLDTTLNSNENEGEMSKTQDGESVDTPNIFFEVPLSNTSNTESEKTPTIIIVDQFGEDPITLREKKVSSCGEKASENDQRFESHCMSLMLPTSERKVVFRSSSLGREGIANRSREMKNYQSKTSSLGWADKTPLRKRRLSSVRGLKDFKRLTIVSEYQGTVRTTFMLSLITVSFILAFLPHLVLMTFKALGDESGTWAVAHNIILRSYFINSVVNPIIYSFCSRNFFSQCRKQSRQHGTLTR